jgi:beta-N-acetylhexosaminidase
MGNPLRRRLSHVLTAALALALAVGLEAPVGAQSPPPTDTNVCTSVAAQLETASGWLGDVGIVLASVCPESAGDGAAATPTLRQLIGQKLMVRMGGTKPSTKLLRRVRRGEVGGVVLLGSNVRSRTQLRQLTQRLQRAAREGGQPPLLIAIDQEGGDVRRVPWAPPTRTVPSMGATRDTRVAFRQGRATGLALHAVGINTDLAPVADIPRSRTSFMYRQGRVFSFDAAVTTRLADAFARGLAAGGVLATMKHFPGIGLVRRNTDRSAGVVRASRSTLDTDLRPYRRAIGNGVPLIMLSNATYTAFDPAAAAGWSRAVAVDLLRDELGFEGISLTDSLDGTAHARGVSAGDLAVRAVGAGVDMVLLTGSERTTERIFDRLLRGASEGDFDRAELTGSWERIQRIKARLGTGAP